MSVDVDASRSAAAAGAADAVGAVRRRLVVRGVVQGVGFRPHVATLADALGLSGACHNDATSVEIEVEGGVGAVAEFERRLVADAPPLARIESMSAADVAPTGVAGFVIEQSTAGSGARTMVPPDTAVCDDCLRELRDPADRRYRHPFITCTNCGPRLTITLDLPYDRPATTMAGFPLCPACAAEYADPRDRRYHAQPIACHDCGPTLSSAEVGVRYAEVGVRDAEVGVRVGEVGVRYGEVALRAAVEALMAGRIVAVKGIGGYHLACDATSPSAVVRLRERKQRPHQPFAVMVADHEAAAEIVETDERSAALLATRERPIVVLPERDASPVADQVAPALGELGVVLAYAPVHHLLLADLRAATGRTPVLVMTSGNASGEPLCYTDADAHSRLAEIADAFLAHDRAIAVPVEDSVIAWSPTGPVPVRRSRGYAPLPVDLVAGAQGDQPATSAYATPTSAYATPTSAYATPTSAYLTPTSGVVVAAGAELKNTVALVREGRAFVSAHVGDLESLASREAHQRVTDQLLGFHQERPDLIVADLHPGYASRAWAQQQATAYGVPLLEVQHHHAHLASLAAEHGRLDEPLLGLVFDGTGYGCDATVWGGELLLLADHGRSSERLGHLGTVRLPGGDAGVRNPVRTAALALLDAGLPADAAALAGELTPAERTFLTRAHESGAGLVDTSSAGRLFDVAASILGVRHRITYEAQAAIELEATARAWRRTTARAATPLPLPVHATPDGLLLDPVPLVRALAEAVAGGIPAGEGAWAFHEALARGAVELAVRAAASTGVDAVGLSGGVFVNRILLAATATLLRDAGLDVLTHARVPANDGGLALGQAAIGHRHLNRRPAPSERPDHP